MASGSFADKGGLVCAAYTHPVFQIDQQSLLSQATCKLRCHSVSKLDRLLCLFLIESPVGGLTGCLTG